MKLNYKEYIQKTKEYGIAKNVKHPVIICSGLPNAQPQELVVFENNQTGQVASLNNKGVEIISFDKKPVIPGIKVTRTGLKLHIPVGTELLGKTVNPLGAPFFEDEKYTKPKDTMELDKKPESIKNRTKIKEQLVTGVTLVDTLLPLGKGQRELIVGDRKTGKTSFLIPLIKNQASKKMVVIYALIGKKKVEIKKLRDRFKKENIYKNIVIVASAANDSPSLIDLTPYTAMALAEYFKENGVSSLVIMDDLTTHAQFYREIALIGKRFPGRESYPGDMFFKHARLLERAGNFKVKNKNVSITCLPLAETTQGDLTGFIVSNLISITDGHILFDTETFNRGIRPAVNVFLSVTRVGKQTQQELSRDLNQRLLILLTNYTKAQSFSHFGAEMSTEARKTLVIGELLYKFFEQEFNQVIPLNVQIIGIGMILQGLLNNFKPQRITEMKNNLVKTYSNNSYAKKVINELVKVSQVDSLLLNIEKNKEKLIKFTGLKFD